MYRLSNGSDVFAQIAGALRPGLAAIVDIYITVWLCYHLHDAKTGHVQCVVIGHNRPVPLVRAAFIGPTVRLPSW